MPSLPDVDLGQLSQARRDLLRSNVPLPPHVRFTPARLRSLNDLWGWMVLCVGGLVVGPISGLLWYSDIWGGHVTRGSSDAASTELAVAVIGIILGLGSAFGIVEDLRRILEQRQGDSNRYGLFLDDEGLMLRVDRSSCKLLAREEIIKAELNQPAGSPTRPACGVIIYRGADGAESSLRIPDDLAESSVHDGIVRGINEWLSNVKPR